MKARRVILLAALTGVIATLCLSAAVPDGTTIVPPSFASPEARNLYDRLSSRLIAPCCWAEPVRLHQSAAASKVRVELVAMIRAGLDGRQIEDRFAAEYGERILGQPRGVKTVVAYAVPAAFAAIALFALTLWLAHRARQLHLNAPGNLPA